MTLLIAGVLLWSLVHLLPIAARGLRQRLVSRLGLGAYSGLFALTILLAVVLIVLGWMSASATEVYEPPNWGWHLNILLMLFSLLLFTASSMKTNIRRWLRHPQLTGVSLWALGHLFANGDLPSLVLFGGIGLWAASSILLLNRRDGPWKKPGKVSHGKDLVVLVVSAAGYAALVLIHPYLFGMPIMP